MSKTHLKNRILLVLSALILVVGSMSACTTGGVESTEPPAQSSAPSADDAGSGDGGDDGAEPAPSGDALTYGDEAYTRGEDGLPQLGGVELSIWMPMESEYMDVINDYTEMDIVKSLMERLDVNLSFSHPAVGQEKENFAILIASDVLPDMIFSGGIDSYYPGGLTMAYQDGLLFDYTELVNDQNTPLFNQYMLGDPYNARFAFDDNDRVVRLGACITGSAESCTTMFGIMVRQDMLEATGLEKPETYDEWYEMLTAMKNNGVQYPLIINKSDYWQTRNALSAGYGLPANTFGVEEDGTVIYGPYEDRFRDYLSMVSTWYTEGLINPDFMNQEQDHTWSMLADDLGGVTADHLWGYNPNYYLAVEVDHPEKAMTALDLPVQNKGDSIRHMVTNRGITHYKYITADTTKPLACVLLLDALYDPSIEFMMSNGIEGLGYTLNDMGYPEIATITPDSPREVLLGSRIHPLETESDSELEYILTSKYCYGVQPECVNTLIKHNYDGIYPVSGVSFTEEESAAISRYQTDITTYREEMILKFVTGNESMDSFEDYQQRLRDLGIEELIKVYQAAYDRFTARG